MPPQMNCPACNSDMRSRSLLSYYTLKPYRVCPDCHAKYTTDRKSKRRQIPIVLLGFLSLGLTAAIRTLGSVWILAALASYVVLWAYVGFALSKVFYVRYPDR